ncbi:tyrosine-type recombinase/integrase [Streptomyces wedmorensis]|uniref:hypothetical protein n=1 Tax=Streptomyces wedmorensis TaxID=43759 RepID=UPI0037B09454
MSVSKRCKCACLCAEKCRHKNPEKHICRVRCECERGNCSHNWTARVRDANGDPADTTFKKKSDAQAYERKVLEAKGSGLTVRPKRLRTTFLSYSEEWIKRPGWRPGTQESYEMNMRKHIQPAFGGCFCTALTPWTCSGGSTTS